jgi:hypothetical protein
MAVGTCAHMSRVPGQHKDDSPDDGMLPGIDTDLDASRRSLFRTKTCEAEEAVEFHSRLHETFLDASPW